MSWSLIDYIESFYFVYAVAISSSYLILAVVSIRSIKKYKQKNAKVNYRMVLSSPWAPSISLVAPAFNEELTIVDNVRSLLSIEYNNYDVIVVNDGSQDHSLEKLIRAFGLIRVSYDIDNRLSFKSVSAVYKSKNAAYKRLIVVDKENGGKADALNAGICVSEKELVACIDVDCVIQSNALLKMAKAYLEEPEKIVAIGGVVRIANSCVIEDGRLVKVNLPDNALGRFQVLEYIRAFLLGRMAWSHLNGLMLISGAFGLFKREVVLEVGGYDVSTVGEDMELVVRMRRKLFEWKRKAKIIYIPEPLCWTEAPSDTSILGKQRNRWTRGTMETLSKHRVMFLNPRYRFFGLVSYPYWFFFEWMAPWIECTGILFFVFLIAINHVNWAIAIVLLVFVYLFAVLISLFALMVEDISYYQYTKRKDLFQMIVAVLTEPILYHPKVVWWSIRGNIDKWKGESSWGRMKRTGFANLETTESVASPPNN